MNFDLLQAIQLVTLGLLILVNAILLYRSSKMLRELTADRKNRKP